MTGLSYKHLEGRSFLTGVRDCYELGCDFYEDNFGIRLTRYARPIDWSADQLDLIRLLHERDGFEMITHWRAEDLRPGDALAMTIGSSNPNHLALYVGGQTILHHLAGRFSCAEAYRDFFRSSTAFLLRHPDVPDLRPVLPATTIEALLHDRHYQAPAG